MRLVLRLRINQSPGDSLSWRFCCEFLPRLEPRKRSSKIPIDNESREAGLASCVYQKLNSFEAKKMRTQKKKRENDLPRNSLDVDLKIWLSDPNNPRVLSTEILL